MSKRHSSIKPSHPGEILREDVLPALKLSKAAFAEALGLSRQKMHEIIFREGRISAEVALRLEAVIGGSAEAWLAVQAECDLHSARKNTDTSQLPRLSEMLLGP